MKYWARVKARASNRIAWGTLFSSIPKDKLHLFLADAPGKTAGRREPGLAVIRRPRA
ncbi:MAG: hypothetical protein ABW185_10215 [Sedimenticola sp.]